MRQVSEQGSGDEDQAVGDPGGRSGVLWRLGADARPAAGWRRHGRPGSGPGPSGQAARSAVAVQGWHHLHGQGRGGGVPSPRSGQRAGWLLATAAQRPAAVAVRGSSPGRAGQRCGRGKKGRCLPEKTDRQRAKKLGVTKIDEQADTDEPSYFKQTSQKTTLLVGSASEVFLGNSSIKYQSAVTCQLIK